MKAEQLYLTREQVASFADACVQSSEVTAATTESVTVVRSALVWRTPKGHERREVPILSFLVAELQDHVRGKAPEDLT